MALSVAGRMFHEMFPFSYQPAKSSSKNGSKIYCKMLNGVLINRTKCWRSRRKLSCMYLGQIVSIRIAMDAVGSHDNDKQQIDPIRRSIQWTQQDISTDKVMRFHFFTLPGVKLLMYWQINVVTWCRRKCETVWQLIGLLSRNSNTGK